MRARMKVITAVLCVVLATIGLLLIKSTRVKAHRPAELELRAYKVEPAVFFQVIKIAPNPDLTNDDSRISLAARDFFKPVGVDLAAPGRSIFFDSRHGMLFVKATRPELNTVEHTILPLDRVPPQIYMKTYFIEVPEADVPQILQSGVALDTKEPNSTEVIPWNKMKSVLRQMESDKADILAEPSVMILSGRQTEMRADNLIVDLIPTLLADSYTLNLRIIGSNGLETNNAVANIWDAQTVVLAFPKKDEARRLILFVSATVIDPAGNRVHSDKELAFNPSTIPPPPATP